jgi:hypothetical protein
MNNWMKNSEEDQGAIRNKAWLTNGIDRALFKPDSEKTESKFEVEAYQIAKALGIECARTEQVTLHGVTGTLSYNFKEECFRYQSVSEIYQAASGIRANCKNGDMLSLQKFNNLSLDEIHNNPVLQTIEKDTVNMLFLDCLISNADRHGNNWELKFSLDGKELLGIAPLFDHGMSQELAPYDYCMVKKNQNEMEISHMSMLKHLSYHYTEQIGRLLDQCLKIDLNEFCYKRFLKMWELFAEQVSDPERQRNLSYMESSIGPLAPLDSKQLDVLNILKHLSNKYFIGSSKELNNLIEMYSTDKINLDEFEERIKNLANENNAASNSTLFNDIE